MSAKRYTDEFKIEAVRQIVEYGRPVAEVAQRLGVSIHSLYGWKRQQGKGEVVRRVEQDQNAEVRRLKAELMRPACGKRSTRGCAPTASSSAIAGRRRSRQRT